eukprot:scpid37651/ scgid9739/ 
MSDPVLSSSTCCSCRSALIRRHKLLLCLHLVCTDCLEQLIQPQDNCVKCPQCQVVTPSPAKGRSHFHTLPTCKPASARTDSGASASGDDIEWQPNLVELEGEQSTRATQCICEHCIEETPASSVCLECSLDLCEEHAIAHTKKRKSAHHRVQPASRDCDDDGSSPEVGAAAASSSRSPCPVHLSHSVTHYCRLCADVACSVCLKQTTHRQHEQMLITIEQAGEESREQIRKLCSDSGHGTCHEGITVQLDLLQTLQDEIKCQAAAVSEQITKEITTKMELLKKREAKLLEDVDRLQWQKSLPVEERRNVLLGCLSTLDRLRQVADGCYGDCDAVRAAAWATIRTSEVTTAAAGALVGVSPDCRLACGHVSDKVTADDISQIGTVSDVSDIDADASKVVHPVMVWLGEEFLVSVRLLNRGKADVSTLSPLYRAVSVGIAEREKPSESAAAHSDVGYTPALPSSPRIRAYESAKPGVWECCIGTPGEYCVTAKIGGVQLGQARRMFARHIVRFDRERHGPGLQITDNGMGVTCATCTDQQCSAFSEPVSGVYHAHLLFESKSADMVTGAFPQCGIVPDDDALPMVGRVDNLRGMGSNGTLYGLSRSNGNTKVPKWKSQVKIALLIDSTNRVFTMHCRQAEETWVHRWKNIPPKVRIQVGLFYSKTSFTLRLN